MAKQYIEVLNGQNKFITVINLMYALIVIVCQYEIKKLLRLNRLNKFFVNLDLKY